MPINPSALSAPEPDPQPPSEAAAAALAGATNEHEDVSAQPKRTRRTKTQLIADAVVPGNDDQVELKDSGTGAKIQRPWLVALEMIRDGKAEFADSAMKYAMMKFDQQKVTGAFAEPKVEQGEPVSDQQQITQLLVVPPDAEVGDEVSIGADTFRVGHGPVLVDGSSRIAINDEIVFPQRRWIREIGAGPNGPWEAVTPISGAGRKSEQNGKGEAPVDVQTERLPHTTEEIAPGIMKIGTGVLEKIGLPDYSSLQIGPITLSRTVLDDGRRDKVMIGDREGYVITAAVEAFQELDDTCEFITRRFRGELQSFLEATGALKQPVSA